MLSAFCILSYWRELRFRLIAFNGLVQFQKENVFVEASLGPRKIIFNDLLKDVKFILFSWL